MRLSVEAGSCSWPPLCPLMVALEAPLENWAAHWFTGINSLQWDYISHLSPATQCLSRTRDFEMLPAFSCTHALFMPLCMECPPPARSFPLFMAHLKCHLPCDASPDTPGRIPLFSVLSWNLFILLHNTYPVIKWLFWACVLWWI